MIAMEVNGDGANQEIQRCLVQSDSPSAGGSYFPRAWLPIAETSVEFAGGRHVVMYWPEIEPVGKAFMAIEVRPFDTALGAEIRGVDLSRPLSGEDAKAIHAAWMEHLVLLFRGQTLSDPQLIAFSRHFGDLEFPPTKLLKLKKGIEQKSDIPPEINVISNVKENGKPIGPHTALKWISAQSVSLLITCTHHKSLLLFRYTMRADSKRAVRTWIFLHHPMCIDYTNRYVNVKKKLYPEKIEL